MSVPLCLNFTPDDDVLPKIKCLEEEEPMVSYELKKKCVRICGDISRENSGLDSKECHLAKWKWSKPRLGIR